MITNRTIITVPRDDPKFDEYKRVLTREKGWNIEETSEAVKYERIDLFEFNREVKNG